MIRVVVADDHPAFLLGVELGLTERGIWVVGTAQDGATAVQTADRLRPDCVVLDVRMPRMSGIAACREISSRGFSPAVVFVSTFSDVALIHEAHGAGARAFLTKEQSVDRLVAAIEALVANPSLQMLAAPDVPLLTPRESAVLGLLGRGYSNKRIATELAISPETVKDYCSSLFTKLGVRDRLAALVEARRLGLDSPA